MINTIAVKRITRDISEIKSHPIEGIGIENINNDIMKYAISMRLMQGIYEGYCLQLYLTFSNDYPTKPPKILIYPKQGFNHYYHEHTFDERREFDGEYGFQRFCIDFLDNDFLNTNVEHSGWNPSYTISSILLQVQNFLSDPDLYSLPNENAIKELMDSMKSYKREFNVLGENGEMKKVVHTWDNPFPKMYFPEKKESSSTDKQSDDDVDMVDLSSKSAVNTNTTTNDSIRLEKIKENLTCFMMKLNYIDDNTILLGYPIIAKKTEVKGTTRMELYPIPELLTFEGYSSQKNVSTSADNDNRLGMYFGPTPQNQSLKSANNEYYNNWLPIYINALHFYKNKKTIFDSFYVLKNGSLPPNNQPYDIKVAFEIVPIILNKMIIGMFNGQSKISSAFITCYFQYALLFKKIISEYNNEFKQYLNSYLSEIKNNNYYIDKKLIPDIGNFMMLLFFSDACNMTDQTMPMWNCLIEEFLIRQMYWMFHGDECKDKMKQCMLSNGYNYELESLYNANQVEKVIDSIGQDARTCFLKYAYESQRGNQLLLVTFLAKKKMEEQGFMEELEKNYGVYLEVDKFIEQMKGLLDGIKDFQSLYKFIGVNFYQGLSEVEMIREAYIKAKKKRYIRDNSMSYNNNYSNNSQYSNYNNYNNGYNNYYNNNYRGRGGRGRGGYNNYRGGYRGGYYGY